MNNFYCDKISCDANMFDHIHERMCLCLDNTDFGDKECPFFKTEEQNRKEIESTRDRLRRIGRADLLDYATYKMLHSDDSEVFG